MEFFCAFIVCGMLCVLTQLFTEMMPDLELPTRFLVILVLGALLVPSGAAAALSTIGQAGEAVTVFSVGQSICDNVYQLIAKGNPAPLVIMILVLCIIAVIGLCTGAALSRKHKE